MVVNGCISIMSVIFIRTIMTLAFASTISLPSSSASASFKNRTFLNPQLLKVPVLFSIKILHKFVLVLVLAEIVVFLVIFILVTRVGFFNIFLVEVFLRVVFWFRECNIGNYIAINKRFFTVVRTMMGSVMGSVVWPVVRSVVWSVVRSMVRSVVWFVVWSVMLMTLLLHLLFLLMVMSLSIVKTILIFDSQELLLMVILVITTPLVMLPMVLPAVDPVTQHLFELRLGPVSHMVDSINGSIIVCRILLFNELEVALEDTEPEIILLPSSVGLAILGQVVIKLRASFRVDIEQFVANVFSVVVGHRCE